MGEQENTDKLLQFFQQQKEDDVMKAEQERRGKLLAGALGQYGAQQRPTNATNGAMMGLANAVQAYGGPQKFLAGVKDQWNGIQDQWNGVQAHQTTGIPSGMPHVG